MTPGGALAMAVALPCPAGLGADDALPSVMVQPASAGSANSKTTAAIQARQRDNILMYSTIASHPAVAKQPLRNGYMRASDARGAATMTRPSCGARPSCRARPLAARL